MFSLSDLAPGNTATSFIRIGYGGSLPAGVRIYDSVHESGLARFLHLTITRGSRAGHAFKADATDYVGAGAGVLFDGRLARFPESFAGGVADPRTWHPTDGHTYRVEMTLRGGEAAMGLSAGPTFVWEARQAAGGP